MIDSYQDVGARVRRGAIAGHTVDGHVRVREDCSGQLFACETLRLTAGPALVLCEGADVVFVAEDGDDHVGYILGILERRAAPPSGVSNAVLDYDGELSVIKIHAHQRLELTCGRAALTMNADGTVVLKGTTVVSRASGVNKIRGAAVRIN
jgi:hypothetical protein